VTAYAALTSGTINPRSYLQPAREASVRKPVLQVLESGGARILQLEDAIIQSCDTYFYQLGERLTVEDFARTARLFARQEDGDRSAEREFGSAPRPGVSRSPVRQAGMDEGAAPQLFDRSGRDSHTPLQLCALTARFANGGKKVQPHIVKEIFDAEERPSMTAKKGPTDGGDRQERSCSSFGNAMCGVVADEKGTGRARRFPTWWSRAKRAPRRIPSGQDHAVFVALCRRRMHRPVCLAIVMENAGHGGSTWRAPVARRSLAACFPPLVRTREAPGAAAQGRRRPFGEVAAKPR